ncbi:MAG TPA: hypothetical protein VMD03_06315 [Steroidobacteraceae bacterium]|nr:hypothetical protein [Steroidobacteraceae bacterium]
MRLLSSDRWNRSDSWEVVVAVADTLSAQALIGLFASEGVPARLQSDTALLGAARQCRILVPREMIRRARCVLWQTSFSDEELAALAVGEASDTEAGEAPERG